jgi:ATP diphosphatase
MDGEAAKTPPPVPAPPGGDDPVARLRAIMRRLRDPKGGCPWDLEQDFASIAPYTLEEAYEVADAIAREAWDELPDELGDLLLQVVYHAQMAEEAGRFDFDDVARAVCDKMVRRHPHVFGAEDAAGRDAAGRKARWEEIKAAERARSRESALDGVPAGLPGLTRALKLQDRAARVGFDWSDLSGVVDKIAEEARELAAETAPDRRAEEFGDLAFALVNLGRRLGLDPDAALRQTNLKFERRFRAVEAALAAEGRRPEQAALEEMDAHWEAAKRAERGHG